jgi:methylase of polypeptide subunit release factors
MMNAQIDIDKVLSELKAIATKAANEEEFKINAERILHEEVLSKLGLQPGRYEYTFISGGRTDALYGHVLIEYKAPGKLSREADIAKAKEQLIGYIRKEAEVEERYRLFLGVILCDKIAFVRYDSRTKNWSMRGPYDLNRETVLRLIEAIRGLRRKRLTVDELLRDFGPGSSIAKNAVKLFYNRITLSKNSKVKALFSDWRRLFSQVCAYSPEKLKGLEADYGIGGRIDYNALLFSIQTYYALIMKLLGAEVAYLHGAGKWLKSYVSELEDAHMRGLDALRNALEDLESGGVFRRFLNITNFMEGDYFSWYLEELDEELANVISGMAKRLADYEPATPLLEPEYTRDLLKRLYQNLVPKRIRHDLGEYYTPDWLAELVLDEVGLTVENLKRLSRERDDTLAPLNLRVLDPACGSGTFLILAMKRLREYAEEHYLGDVLANYFLKNVVGFDLNPLAVLAARTNYLLAMADLISNVKGSIEIPVYLSDSLLVEERTTIMSRTYVVRTYVSEFQIPQSIVEGGLLGKILEAVDRYVRLRYKADDFEQVVKKELNLDDEELRLVGVLYKAFLKLEDEGKNHVWASVIKNAFAPLTLTSQQRKFDFVIGNPPWINWESLPEDYRNTSKVLWDRYGLLEKTKGMGLGKVKRDLSSLFLAACFDRYLEDGGGLSFLMPFTILKTHASAGFRKFLALKGRVVKVHDTVELFPFEGAINRTCLIYIKKAGRTDFPITCEVWRKSIKGEVPTEASLEHVTKTSERYKAILAPIKRNDAGTPWMIISEKAYEVLQRVMRPAKYRAYAGVYTGLDGAFYVNILSRKGDSVLIQNMHETGKKKLKQVQSLIEPVLVYPLVRGRDVKRWFFNYSSYIIIPTDKKGQNILIQKMKIDYPKAYEYFLNFERELRERSVYKLVGEKQSIWYGLYVDIGNYTFAKYKVMWKNVAGKISGKAEFSAAVVGLVNDSFLGEGIAIPNVKLMFVPVDNEDEAHYICAFLNSSITRLIVASYVIETGISTHILQNVFIPKFDEKDKIHLEISRLSKKAHQLAREKQENELKKVEEEIDRTIAQLYGLTEDELKEIRKSLAVLEGEEVEEEVAKEEPKQTKVNFLDTVMRPNIIGVFEVSISNPIKEKITIELQIPERPVTIKTDKEEDEIKVKVPPLEAGEYKVPYKITTSKGVAEGEFTLYVKEQERRRVKEEFASKLDELLGD